MSEPAPRPGSPFDRLPGGPRALLLIQLGDIGDVVLTTPVLQALRENYPRARLFACVREKARELIEDCPWTDGVVSVGGPKRPIFQEIHYQWRFWRRLRRHRCDAAIELRTGTRGAVLARLSGARVRIGRYAADGHLWRNRMFTHLVDPGHERHQYVAQHGLNILAPLGLRIRNLRPVLTVPPHRREAAAALFGRLAIPGRRPLIALHPFSLWPYKELQIRQCIDLARALVVGYDCCVAVTGAADERARAQAVADRCGPRVFNLAGLTSIGELAAVLQASRLFVGVDTAALHMAAAVGTPTVGIFGPTDPVSWAPRGARHAVVAKTLDCVPCRQKGCGGSGVSRCLRQLTVDDILPAVAAGLSGPPPPAG